MRAQRKIIGYIKEFYPEKMDEYFYHYEVLEGSVL